MISFISVSSQTTVLCRARLFLNQSHVPECPAGLRTMEFELFTDIGGEPVRPEKIEKSAVA